MPAPPPNQHLLLQRQVGRELIVLLGPEDGSAPNEENEAPYLRVIEVSRSSSNRALDYCRMEFDFTLAGVSLENLKTPTKWKRQVEVRIADSEGKPRGGLLFWGELTRQSIAIEDKESCILTATVQPYHFGPAASGAALREFTVVSSYDRFGETTTEKRLLFNGGEMSFNPLVDDEIKFNRSDADFEPLPGQLFGDGMHVDVESVRTEAAREHNNNDEEAYNWILSDVIRSVARACNIGEDFIKNPDVSVFFLGSPDIQNLNLPLGETLPAYLDAILLPLGYSWCLDYSLKQDPPETEEDPPPPPERVVTIRIFSRQEGPEKELYLQAKGERYDRALTNLNAVSVEWDIANLSNEIVGVMPAMEYEVTIELFRGWPEESDELTAEDLDRDNPNSSYYTETLGSDIWRLWVGNEACDYRDLRGVDFETGNGLPSVLDLDSVFGADQYLRRRRKLDDCLTFDSSGFRRRPFLEYKNPEYDAEEEGSIEWLPVPIEWGFVVLEEQIGIRFTGAQPPAEIIAMGDDAKLRITGTIKADVRTEIVATSTASSPNGRKVVLYIDLADKFRYAQIQGTGPHASVLEQPYGSAEVLDVTQPDAYIEKIRDREQSAAVTASIELFGLHYNYQIGDVLTKIAGRNISLDRNSEEAEQSAYLQIMGIRWLPQEQKTEILTAPTEVSL